MQPILAPALNKGDVVSVVAPAGALDLPAVQRAIERLQQWGLHIKTYGPFDNPYGYLAAPDTQRIEDLQAAIQDPQTTAILAARGGYGCARILHAIDWGMLRQRPKIIAGFSDLTALHAAVDRHAQLVTFHSPNLQDGLGAHDGLSPPAAKSFWRAVTGNDPDSASSDGYDLLCGFQPADPIRTLVPGTARGRLAGGNLAVFCGLVGTAYFPDLSGRILFLEDVGEPPYRVDRMLRQLLLAGALDRLAGVILGQFTQCDSATDKPSLTLQQLWRDYFDDRGIPVITGYPVGHVRDNLTLPLGAPVELDATGGSVRVLQNPVRCHGVD
jgi:muramoyltetrapeptide carboxypeptidase